MYAMYNVCLEMYDVGVREPQKKSTLYHTLNIIHF